MDPRYGLWQSWFETEAVAMAHRNGRAGLVEERWLVPMATAKYGYDRLHCRALRWVGCNLVRWGSRLQQRYDTVGQVPTFYPAKSIH
ncbi:MAG: hypothetical protein JXM73_07515 [Anaerolineae bacterium]|nr:hypothetical protein [Anaerolineae bacterium]